MEGKKSHHNLRHLLTPQQQAAALQQVAGVGATAADAGELILAARQKDLQQLFATVYSVPTNSFNNEWLRRKLLSAVGLPPSWRPPPPPLPDLPSVGEECSRYGRRRRRVTPYGAPEHSSEGSEASEGERDASPTPPPAVRRRPSPPAEAETPSCQPSRQPSADVSAAGAQPAAAEPAAPSAIQALQARAAAAFSAPTPLLPFSDMEQRAVCVRLISPPGAPAAPAALPQAAPPSFAARMAAPPGAPPPPPLLQPAAGAPAASWAPLPLPLEPAGISLELHNLFQDFQQGHLSFDPLSLSFGASLFV